MKCLQERYAVIVAIHLISGMPRIQKMSQKKLPTIFCANQPINYSKKQNNCFGQSFHTCLENVTNTAITNTYHGFKFRDSVCSGCHDSTMLSVNISHNVIVLFITFANGKQLIYQKILFLKIMDMYKKYCLNF